MSKCHLHIDATFVTDSKRNDNDLVGNIDLHEQGHLAGSPCAVACKKSKIETKGMRP